MSTSCQTSDNGSDVSGQPPGFLILGTSLVIGASFVSTFGVNLQKLAHLKNERLPPQQRQPYAKLFTWQLGMLLMVLGSAMDVVALPFVPQSRVAVLGSVTMVANVIITPVFLKETLTSHDLFGCGITVTGCTIASWFGAHAEMDMTPSCLVESLTQVGFLLYFTGVMAYLAILLVFILSYEHKTVLQQCLDDKLKDPSYSTKLESEIPSPSKTVTESQGSFLDTVPEVSPKTNAFIYASFAGTAGAQSIMFAKGALEMGWSAMTGKSSIYYLFICLPPFGACLWCQVHYLNQIFWIIMGILCGLIFYREYTHLTTLHSWMFAIGCAINLAGVIILSQRQTQHSTNQQQRTATVGSGDSNLSTGLLNSDDAAIQPLAAAKPLDGATVVEMKDDSAYRCQPNQSLL